VFQRQSTRSLCVTVVKKGKRKPQCLWGHDPLWRKRVGWTGTQEPTQEWFWARTYKNKNAWAENKKTFYETQLRRRRGTDRWRYQRKQRQRATLKCRRESDKDDRNRNKRSYRSNRGRVATCSPDDESDNLSIRHDCTSRHVRERVLNE
jgi:hypothetical protein